MKAIRRLPLLYIIVKCAIQCNHICPAASTSENAFARQRMQTRHITTENLIALRQTGIGSNDDVIVSRNGHHGARTLGSENENELPSIHVVGLEFLSFRLMHCSVASTELRRSNRNAHMCVVAEELKDDEKSPRFSSLSEARRKALTATRRTHSPQMDTNKQAATQSLYHALPPKKESKGE